MSIELNVFLPPQTGRKNNLRNSKNLKISKKPSIDGFSEPKTPSRKSSQPPDMQFLFWSCEMNAEQIGLGIVSALPPPQEPQGGEGTEEDQRCALAWTGRATARRGRLPLDALTGLAVAVAAAAGPVRERVKEAGARRGIAALALHPRRLT